MDSDSRGGYHQVERFICLLPLEEQGDQCRKKEFGNKINLGLVLAP